MTRQEVIAILKILKANYPRFYQESTKEDLKDVVDLWSMMFADDNTKVVTEAVKALIVTLKFPPTIADVKEKILIITKTDDEITEGEAWHLVFNALRNSSYNSVDEFEKLPTIIKKVVGSATQLREWASMDSDTVNSVIQSNFMRSYKAKRSEQKELEKLPETAKQLRMQLKEKFTMIKGDKEEPTKIKYLIPKFEVDDELDLGQGREKYLEALNKFKSGS